MEFSVVVLREAFSEHPDNLVHIRFYQIAVGVDVPRSGDYFIISHEDAEEQR